MKQIITSINLIMLFLSLPVYAQQNKKLAKQHYLKAEKFYVNGEFQSAVVEYKKAFELSGKDGLLFNIAQCHRQLNNYDKALFFYKLYLSKNPNSSFREEIENHIKILEKKLSEITKKLGKVTIITNPKKAEILLDSFSGKPLGVSPIVVDITSGTHLLVIKKKGYNDKTHKLEVKAGQMNFVTINLVPSSSNDGKNQTTKPDNQDNTKTDISGQKSVKTQKNANMDETKVPTASVPFYKKWWFIAGASTTAILLGGTVYTGMKALDYQSQYKDDPDSDIKDKGESSAMTSDILLGASILVGGATVLAVIFSDRKEDNTDSEIETTDNKKTFSILPSIGYNNFGFVLNWNF